MIKKTLAATVFLFLLTSSAMAGSLTVKATDSSYVGIPEIAVTVKSTGNTWRGYTERDGIFRINGVPEGEEFEVRWDRGDAEPIYTRGMYFPANGSDLLVSIEYGIIHKGDYYAVYMPSNPTTGYSWEILGQDLSGSLTYRDKTYETSETRPGSKLRCGAGGTEKWVFKATGLGRTQILFGYKRNWEKFITPVSYHICTVMSRIVHQ